MTWKRSRWATFAAFGCVHAPAHDMDAVRWAVGRVAEIKPDYLVCVGDLLEASSASRWANEDEWDLLDEYRAADAILSAFREAAPDAKLVFTEGNHDHNIRAENRLPKKLRRLCDYREHIPALRDWAWFEYRNDPSSAYRVGQVSFAHGFETSAAGVMREAYRFAPPNGLYVSAHTHRPEPPRLLKANTKLTLDRASANTGTLRKLDPDYMRRNNADDWGHAIVYGEARTGRALRERRYWTATTEVHRMAHGEPAPGMEYADAGAA